MKRNVTAWITCKTHGSQLFNPQEPFDFKMCNDTSCTHCTNLHGAIKREAEMYTDLIMGLDLTTKSTLTFSIDRGFGRQVEYLSVGDVIKKYNNCLTEEQKGLMRGFPKESLDKVATDLANLENKLMWGDQHPAVEVECFKQMSSQEALTQVYLNEGGIGFSVKNIDMLRDGGTIVITCENKHKEYYPEFRLDKDGEKISLDGDVIENEATLAYLQQRIERHLQNLDWQVNMGKKVIDCITNK